MLYLCFINMYRSPILWLYLLFSWMINPLIAQFNFQIGYQFSYADFTAINGAVDYYNVTNPGLTKKLGKLTSMNAITLGVRQGLGIVSVIGSWTNQIDRLHSVGPQAGSSNPSFNRELFFKNQIYSLGFESLSGNFGLGACIDLRLLSIKNRDTGSDFKRTILVDSKPGSTFYTFIDLPVSPRMGLVLKLSYGFPWNSIGLKKFSDFLTPVFSIGSESFRQMGLSLIFSNGRQPRY